MFLNNHNNAYLRSCTIVYAFGKSCQSQIRTSSNESRTDIVMIDPLILSNSQNKSQFCFNVTATDETFTARVEGTSFIGMIFNTREYCIGINVVCMHEFK